MVMGRVGPRGGENEVLMVPSSDHQQYPHEQVKIFIRGVKMIGLKDVDSPL